MQIQPAPPAPSTPAVLSPPAPAPAQIPTAQTAPTLPAAPAHPVQAAPAAKTQAPAPPTFCTTAAQTATPAPATTPTVVHPVQGVPADTTVEHSAPTPAPVDTEVEAKLTAEITKLWSVQKAGKDSVRRTRAELKALRQQLGEKLHAMKAILVGTGREGGWAPYLRGQNLPLATANRYVAEHQARIAQPAEKLLIEQHSEPTLDDARKLAEKLLPALSRILISQELVHEFVRTVVWNIDVAEATETDEGLEIPRLSHENSDEAAEHAVELASPPPAVL